jgi:PAS domain S-box-containing protein
MIKSLRYRLLAWLLSFVFLTFVFVIPSNFIHQNKTKRIRSIAQEINALYIDFLKDSRTISDFLLVESINPEFYITGQSRQLMEHYRINERISNTLISLKEDKKIKAYPLLSDLNNLSVSLNDFNILFDSIVYLTYKRGYNNFGLEGEMIDYSNRLETASVMSKNYLYHLHRNEKEYFHWHDASSLKNFRSYVSEFRKSIEKDYSLAAKARYELLDLLNNYVNSFERLVALDNKIGLTNNTNLSSSLNETSKDIEALFYTVTRKSNDIQQSMIKKLNLIYICYLLLIIGFSVLTSFLISKHIVHPLERLTMYISSLTKNNFNDPEYTLDLKNSASEISQIYREFRNMLAQLCTWEKQNDTALKNAEDNKKRYQELADMLPQSIFETDPWGNFTYVNKAWFSTFGHSMMDLKKGINLSETLVSESEDIILGDAKLEGSNFSAVRKDNSRFEASVYLDNIVKDRKVIGKRGIIIDISDRIRYIRELKDKTSKALTSDQLKSSFLANMSHEIRTPMNSIIGFSNLLASEEVPEEQKKEFVHFIQSSGEILLNLIDDIIDIAKIEAGELKIVKKECNLPGLLHELQNTFNEVKNRINKQQVEIVLSLDDKNKNLVFKTDPFRLRQILSNLLGNAIKFTEHGSVEFGFKTILDDKLEFYVRDTGIGLTREELDFIFERFKRSHQSDEKNIIGTGLGLTISKNLVELMGGEMWVDSSPGNGTTFFFTLPYLKVTKPLPESSTEESSDLGYNWKGKNFLLVEDDIHSMNFLTEILRKTQATIIQAWSGNQAVEICLQNTSLHLVIMDIQLPGMNGLEATRHIKQINPRLPVIAQTAFAMAGDRERITQAGCDDYIPKPIDIKQLLPKINNHLKNIDSIAPSLSLLDEKQGQG